MGKPLVTARIQRLLFDGLMLRQFRHSRERDNEVLLVFALIAFSAGSIAVVNFVHHSAAAGFLPGRCSFGSEVSFSARGCDIVENHKANTWYSYVSLVGGVGWTVLDAQGNAVDAEPRTATSTCPTPKESGGIQTNSYEGSGCECTGCDTNWPQGVVLLQWEAYKGAASTSTAPPSISGCTCNDKCSAAARAVVAQLGVMAQPTSNNHGQFAAPGSVVPCWYNPDDTDSLVWFARPRPLAWLVGAMALYSPVVFYMLLRWIGQRELPLASAAALERLLGWRRSQRDPPLPPSPSASPSASLHA